MDGHLLWRRTLLESRGEIWRREKRSNIGTYRINKNAVN
jgi:hypothetical protein